MSPFERPRIPSPASRCDGADALRAVMWIVAGRYGNVRIIRSGTSIGAVTFTGSLVAFGKLQGIIRRQPVVFPLQTALNAVMLAGLAGFGVWLLLPFSDPSGFWILLAAAGILGVLLVIPIGGADMPVVISFLNSC